MKKDIHPILHEAVISCSCGAVLKTLSTEKDIRTEICSLCHPFYTGKKKMIDTTGRVDRFKKLTEKSAKKKEIARKAKGKEVTAKKKSLPNPKKNT